MSDGSGVPRPEDGAGSAAPHAPAETHARAPRAGSRTGVAGACIELLVLVVAVVAAHLGLGALLPSPAPWGDELHYLRVARRDAAGGDTSLLPGTLGFDHRPELAPRLFANVIDAPAASASPAEANAAMLASIELLQIGLLALVVALVWLQARMLGIGRAGALVAGALVGTFPWFAFHAHAAWPELLHAALVALAFVGLLAARARGQAAAALACAVAGLAIGYALHAKGTLAPLAPVLVVFAFVAHLGRGAERSLPRAVSATLAFATCALLVVVPQLVANDRAGFGMRLAANRWWNLELGLTALEEPTPERLAALRAEGVPEGLFQWLPSMDASMRYGAASADPVEREEAARERVLAYVERVGVGRVLADQLPKYARVLLRPEPSFDQSVTYRRRWGADPPWYLRAARLPSRVLWFALLATALLGVVRRWRRDAGWLLATLFVAYLFAALYLVPVKFRFVLPVVPFLALFAGATVADLVALRARRGTGAIAEARASSRPR